MSRKGAAALERQLPQRHRWSLRAPPSRSVACARCPPPGPHTAARGTRRRWHEPGRAGRPGARPLPPGTPQYRCRPRLLRVRHGLRGRPLLASAAMTPALPSDPAPVSPWGTFTASKSPASRTGTRSSERRRAARGKDAVELDGSCCRAGPAGCHAALFRGREAAAVPREESRPVPGTRTACPRREVSVGACSQVLIMATPSMWARSRRRPGSAAKTEARSGARGRWRGDPRFPRGTPRARCPQRTPRCMTSTTHLHPAIRTVHVARRETFPALACSRQCLWGERRGGRARLCAPARFPLRGVLPGP